MKNRILAIFWGLVMIAAGVVFVLDETGIVNLDLLSKNIWAAVFATMSVFFFITYFLHSTRDWGWLFPACILGSIALIMFIEGTALGNLLSGAPVLIAVAVPFLVAFIQNPKTNWWTLLPAWIMTVISVIVLFADNMSGGLIGSLVLYSIALPFLVVFLWNRQQRWALIPFAVLSVVGLIPLLENVVSDEMIGMIVMFLFAIPFYVVYFWTRKQWWALIPAGVFTSIGLVVLYANTIADTSLHGVDRYGGAIILGGIGATFGILWLLRSMHQTDWAKIPALVLFGFAGLSLLTGRNFETYWPIVLIAAGIVILAFGLLRKPPLEKN